MLLRPGSASAAGHALLSASRRPAAAAAAAASGGALASSQYFQQQQQQQQSAHVSSSSSTSSSYNAQRRREWAVVVTAAGGLAVSGSWYWFHVRPRRQAEAIQHHELLQQQQQQQQQAQAAQAQAQAAQAAMPRGSRAFSTSATTSFLIPTRASKSKSGGGGASSQPGQKVITLLTESQVNHKLRANEHSVIVDRPPGVSLVSRYDSNVVPSNDPCEDRRVEIIVESDHVIPELASSTAATSTTKGDLYFGAIMDGHAGYHTSALLTQKLISAVALELDKVFGAKDEYAELAARRKPRSVLSTLASAGAGAGDASDQQPSSIAGKMWRSVFGAAPGPSAQHSATFVQPPTITSAAPSSSEQAKSSSRKQAAPATHDAVSVSSGLESDPEVIKHAIRKAFLALDAEIVNTPVQLLKEYELSLAAAAAAAAAAKEGPPTTTPSTPKPIQPGTASVHSAGPATQNNAVLNQAGALSQLASSLFPSSPSSSTAAAFTATQRTVYEAMLPALSGSCALLAYIDSARGDLYMACTGDSRAIAGWYDTAAQRWIVEPLSVDQTGRNPAEVKRMRSEHPLSEASTVIMSGRVLGGLEPTRAFGDARYKWERNVQERLYETFLPGGRAAARGPPRLLETPPYVTAQPEVVFRKIAPGLASSSSASSTRETKELRFIVMATDGLWDMLENEEVGALVAGHLDRVRGTVLASSLHDAVYTPRKALQSSSPQSPPLQPSPQGQQQQQQQQRSHPLSKAPANLRAYTFEDDNLSTHLVRNALGGANRDRVAGLLAIPSPESRWYRDDITVNVILFNTPAQQAEAREKAEAAAAAAASSSSSSPPRSKL
ncbi:hypothetical protein OC835_003545 [Tilletia horrida]|nr:hypothetical protein OC835_003545 [Tilletia horrida]